MRRPSFRRAHDRPGRYIRETVRPTSRREPLAVRRSAGTTVGLLIFPDALVFRVRCSRSLHSKFVNRQIYFSVAYYRKNRELLLYSLFCARFVRFAGIKNSADSFSVKVCYRKLRLVSRDPCTILIHLNRRNGYSYGACHFCSGSIAAQLAQLHPDRLAGAHAITSRTYRAVTW